MTIPNDQEAIKPEEAVLPCPFCGSDAIDDHNSYMDLPDGTREWYYGCLDCGAAAPHIFNGETPLQAWNRRA